MHQLATKLYLKYCHCNTGTAIQLSTLYVQYTYTYCMYNCNTHEVHTNIHQHTRHAPTVQWHHHLIRCSSASQSTQCRISLSDSRHELLHLGEREAEGTGRGKQKERGEGSRRNGEREAEGTGRDVTKEKKRRKGLGVHR